MATTDRRHGFTTEKSPQQLGRDAVQYQRTVSDMTQRDDTRRGVDQGLLKEWNDAKMAGIPVAKLPVVHGKMSPVDVENAQRQIRQLRGLPTQFPAQKPATPAAPVAPAPLTPAIMNAPAPAATGAKSDPASAGTPDASIMQGVVPASYKPPVSRTTPAPVASGPASPAPADPLKGLVRTPTGLQAPALRPDGSQMSNPDGTARYVGTLPNRVPAGVQSQVLDTGVGATNARGETPVQTTRGPVIAVDPLKDLSKNWLAKGDPLLPQGADRGVVISPKYGGGVGYAYGSGAAPNPATPTKPAAPATPAPAAPIVPAPASAFTSIGAPAATPTTPPRLGFGDLHVAESTPSPVPLSPRAQGAQRRAQVDSSVGNTAAGAVSGVANAASGAMGAVENKADYAAGFVAGPQSAQAEEEKRKRMLEPTPQFSGFAANSF